MNLFFRPYHYFSWVYSHPLNTISLLAFHTYFNAQFKFKYHSLCYYIVFRIFWIFSSLYQICETKFLLAVPWKFIFHVWIYLCLILMRYYLIEWYMPFHTSMNIWTFNTVCKYYHRQVCTSYCNIKNETTLIHMTFMLTSITFFKWFSFCVLIVFKYTQWYIIE